MEVPGTARERIIALLSVALVFLLARFGAAQLNAPAVIGRGLYVLAVGCLLGCVVVIALDNR
ncbi:hypothetical protein [Natronomonas gomsonensis]|uniref:hypothetical protein n=1 Tax=Natronomonas gomsonensis TaxID=1046043 RepID=UPI0015BACFB6|nr:hypothetical protein [Natronomonas gomsonensis]